MQADVLTIESKGIIITDTCEPIAIVLTRPSDCLPLARVKELKSSSRALSALGAHGDLMFAALLILDGWRFDRRTKTPAWVIDYPIDCPHDSAPGYLKQAAACLRRVHEDYTVSLNGRTLTCSRRRNVPRIPTPDLG